MTLDEWCADIVDAGSLATLTGLLSQRLTLDEGRVSREGVRAFYFGDIGPGESSEWFFAAVDETVATRDALLAASTGAGLQVA